jgi:hypothetical protein
LLLKWLKWWVLLMKEETVVFVWRCPDYLGEYDYEGLLFLYAEEDHVY